MDPARKYEAQRRAMWRWLGVMGVNFAALCFALLCGAEWGLGAAGVLLAFVGVSASMVWFRWWMAERYFAEAVKERRQWLE